MCLGLQSPGGVLYIFLVVPARKLDELVLAKPCLSIFGAFRTLDVFGYFGIRWLRGPARMLRCGTGDFQSELHRSHKLLRRRDKPPPRMFSHLTVTGQNRKSPTGHHQGSGRLRNDTNTKPQGDYPVAQKFQMVLETPLNVKRAFKTSP